MLYILVVRPLLPKTRPEPVHEIASLNNMSGCITFAKNGPHFPKHEQSQRMKLLHSTITFAMSGCFTFALPQSMNRASMWNFEAYCEKASYADVSSWVRGLNFGLSHPLHPYFVYYRATITLVSLHICAGSPELSLLDNATSTKISYAGPNRPHRRRSRVKWTQVQ